MTRSRGIRVRRRWTPAEDALLVVAYPHIRTRVVADWLMVSERAAYCRAHGLGLKKTPEFLQGMESGRLNKLTVGGVVHRFSKGHVPANKGLRRPGWAPGRMRETQFKKGEMRGAAQHNYVPIGSLRITRDGTLERKVSDDPDIYPARRWKPVARLVWEAVHGPIPPKHLVRFKPGLTTTIESQITLDKLEVISMAENMRRNSYHRYPQPIPQLIQLKGAVRRQINKRLKHEEQDGRPA